MFWIPLLLLLVAGRILYGDELQQRVQYDYFTCNMEASEYTDIAVKDGEIIQRFDAEQTGLYTFFFWLDNCSSQDSGVIRAQLRDLGGRLYYENQYDLSALGEGEFTWMGGTTDRLRKGKRYELVIRIENAVSNASIRSVESGNLLEGLKEYCVNGEPRSDLALYFLQSYLDSYSIGTVWLFLWVSSFGVALAGSFLSRKNARKTFKVIIGGWGIVASFLVIEILNESIDVIAPKYILINCCIIGAVSIIMHIILKKWSKYITLLLCMILGLVNYYVKQFRGTNLQVIDFKSVPTAMSIVGNYELMISWQIYTAIMIMWMTIGLMVISDKQIDEEQIPEYDRKSWIGRMRLGSAAGGVLILMIISSVYVPKESFNWFELNKNFPEYGWCYTNMILMERSKIQKPEGYSDESIEKIVSSIEKKPPKTDIIPQNLIVIMNESFSDLGILGNLETDRDYMPFIHSLEENVVKGNLYVSTFGGNTAVTEYEFLTGNTEHFFPQGTVPYLSVCQKEEEGLCRILQRQNYYTVAMHPYEAGNWNRDKVYESMNFDEFWSLEDYENSEYLRNYISDRADYDKIIEVVENFDENKNLFIFNVTMQNHGGYDINNGLLDTSVRIENFESSVAETYLSLVYESDRAFEYLLDYFSSSDKKTMVVMFGDHMPSLPDNVYDSLYGRDRQGLSAEERNKMYITPYIIWTNYDIELEARGNISANYLGSYVLECAGLGMPDYNRFLCSLMDQIPAIGQYGLVTREGEFTEYGNGEEILEEYRMLQYMRVKDRGSRYYNCFSN